MRLRESGLGLVNDHFVTVDTASVVKSPSAAELSLSTSAPEVSVKKVPTGLDAILVRQNRLSDPDAIPVIKVRAKHKVSRERLKELRETLRVRFPKASTRATILVVSPPLERPMA